MPILAIDTATRRLSVAVASGGRVVSQASMDAGHAHSTLLLGVIEKVLIEAGLRPDSLSAVGATSGPGSFTGMRIGIATAKGIALAAGIPLAGFSTLLVLAEALAEAEIPAGDEAEICAVVDAGRGHVYRGSFRIAPDGFPRARPSSPETACLPEVAIHGVRAGWIVGGDGALVHRERLLPGLPEGARLLPAAPPLAPSLSLLVAAAERDGRLREHSLVPSYVRVQELRESRGK